MNHWDFFIGVDPKRVSAPAWILFPHRANILCCGLAGILTIKKAGQGETADPGVHLSDLFEQVTQQDMKRIREGAIPSERYLNGPDALSDLEQYI